MATKRTRDRPLPARPASAGDLTPDTPVTEDLAAWLAALTARAEAGDAAANRDLLAAYEAVPRLWEGMATLRDNAERSWLELMVPEAAGRRFMREALRRELEGVRRAAAGADPSPLERLLADRVALCWLAAVYADTQYAQKLAEGMGFKEGEFHQRRSERAQRQFLRAVQTLATVRRLVGPVVQVNVGERQINVAG